MRLFHLIVTYFQTLNDFNKALRSEIFDWKVFAPSL